MTCSLLLLTFLTTFPATARGWSPARHVRVPAPEIPADSKCSGGIDIPIEIVIDAVSPQARPGGFVEVFGTVTPRQDLEGLRLRFEGEGSALIFNREPWNVGRVPADVPFEFSVLARFVPGPDGAVHVWAETESGPEEFPWKKRQTLYAITHEGRLYTGMGDWQRLRRMAIEDDVAAGLTTPEQARERERALAHIPFVRTDREPVYREFSDAEERLNTVIGAPASRDRAVSREDHHPADMILVRGTVLWTDENGVTHPAFGAAVDIRDSDFGFDENIVTTITDVDGNYEAVVDNDDGIGAGDRDIFVRVRTANAFVDTMTAGVFGGTYEMSSPVHDETPGGTTITENFVAANTGTGPAVSVFQAATWIAVYAHDRSGSIGSVDVVWPHGGSGSYYDGDVNIGQAERWDWDTIHHEYGHFVMDELDIEDNPGGPHSIGDCVSEVRDSKEDGVKLAWGEGWPTFFGTAGQQVLGMAALSVPRVGDALYQDLEDSSLVYSLESQDGNGRGEDNEVAVQRLLWDLFDGNADSRDAVSRSDQTMWNAIDGADPQTLSGGWSALRSGQSSSTLILMGEIASDHWIGPRLTAPAQGTTVSPSNATFSWNADVGCSSGYDGDSFDLVFYDAATSATLLTIPGLASPSASLSEAQIATLVSSTHQVLWGVEGRNGSSPSTGPYLGETFQITVNRPPVANAGTDQTVECTSAGTTVVALNGTASSDPDGDTLTYSWSAPGVVFDDPSSATPNGNFGIGTHTVTLVVSDGIEQDSDTVSVTVHDTTPPVIACPVDVTVECTGDLGVQADDPQLAPFFAGASATDTCDLAPAITSDAPAFFPLGQTIVTFTATDAHGNQASCQATVTVVDTQAPTISAAVSPVVLWPANHKMVTITANVVVTDECDPNPTFVLTSITSNEPDEGLGDGNAPDDVQNAAFGTADTSFELRAERAGPLSGRVYTITYTGFDSSGNSSQTQVQVTVPHAQ